MNTTLQHALEVVTRRLKNMSPNDFNDRLNAHKNGDLAYAIHHERTLDTLLSLRLENGTLTWSDFLEEQLSYMVNMEATGVYHGRSDILEILALYQNKNISENEALERIRQSWY